MFSIICVYNNENILNEYLLKSLSIQNNDYELILLNNSNNTFKSASEALNYCGSLANREYLIFSHQDISFNSPNFLNDLSSIICSLDKFGAVGVAGRTAEGTYSNIKHGLEPSYAGDYRILEPLSVQTLDECFVVIPKDIFRLFKFDPITCQNWHLYVVDYCLNIKRNNNDVYVIPIDLYHRSKGYSMSIGYYLTLNTISNKYRNDFNYIFCIGGSWSTNSSIWWQLLVKKIKHKKNNIITKLKRIKWRLH